VNVVVDVRLEPIAGERHGVAVAGADWSGNRSAESQAPSIAGFQERIDTGAARKRLAPDEIDRAGGQSFAVQDGCWTPQDLDPIEVERIVVAHRHGGALHTHAIEENSEAVLDEAARGEDRARARPQAARQACDIPQGGRRGVRTACLDDILRHSINGRWRLLTRQSKT
jgi:hypothetical protein